VRGEQQDQRVPEPKRALPADGIVDLGDDALLGVGQPRIEAALASVSQRHRRRTSASRRFGRLREPSAERMISLPTVAASQRST
jgi:hypothetical protein